MNNNSNNYYSVNHECFISLLRDTWDLPYNLSSLILNYRLNTSLNAGTNTEQNGCGSCTMAAGVRWDKLCEGKQWRYYT